MKTLVCLHAAISGPGTWDKVRPDLEALGYQLVCPTLLGHENAVRRDAYPLATFRDQVVRDLEGLGRFALAGHSLGAFVASLVAKSLPIATVTEVDAGHRIHTKAADRWLTAVRDFLEP